MKDSNWGHCNHCKHFGSPARSPLGGEEAACRHPTLGKHRLLVFGAGGCDLFTLRAGMTPEVERPRPRA